MQFAKYRSLLHRRLGTNENQSILKASEHPIIVEGVNVSNPRKDTLRIYLLLVRHECHHEPNKLNTQQFTSQTTCRKYEDGSNEVISSSHLAENAFLKGFEKENLVGNLRVFLEPRDELYCYSQGHNATFDCSVHYIEIESQPKI